MMNIVQLCLDMGAANACKIETADIVFVPELRTYCEQNSCGRYARNYTCPPFIGEVNELTQVIQGHHDAVIWQNIYTLEDSYDFEGMMRGQTEHNKQTREIYRVLKDQFDGNVLVLGAGGCTLCEECGIMTNTPCRFPDMKLSSLEAYGIHVSELARATEMNYINGVATVTYFSGAFWG